MSQPWNPSSGPASQQPYSGPLSPQSYQQSQAPGQQPMAYPPQAYPAPGAYPQGVPGALAPQGMAPGTAQGAAGSPAVRPVQHPEHDGRPADGTRALIGDPGAAIGTIVSVSSTLSLDNAARPLNTKKTKPLGRAITLAILGLPAGWVAGNLLDQRSVLPLVLTVVGAVMGFLIGRALTKPNRPGGLGTCWWIGSEGIATGRRTTAEETFRLLPFSSVRSFDMERTRTSYQRAGRTAFTSDSYTARFVGHDGTTLESISGSPPKDDPAYQPGGRWFAGYEDDYKKYHFVVKAEAAYMKYKLPIVLEQLKRGSTRFFMDSATDFIDLTADGLTISLRGWQGRYPFSFIRQVSIAGGRVTIATTGPGAVEFKLSELHDNKLFLALLETVGIKIG
jgi:uncharacterized membrane protein YeaQ/YmgE (transglycosylase-associated protein family)